MTESYKTLVKQLLQLNFNPSNPIGIAQYDAVDSMVVLDNNSMMGSILRLGGPWKGRGRNSYARDIRSLTCVLLGQVLLRARNPRQSSSITLRNRRAEMTGMANPIDDSLSLELSAQSIAAW